MSLYEQNLRALLQVNPQLGAQLLALNTNEKFDVFVDEKDSLNINIAERETAKVVYETVPVQETALKMEAFEKDFSRYPYLYHFGIGNGVFYKLLLQNELHRRIVLVEPELEILYIALNFMDFTQELAQRRLILFTPEQVDFSLAIELFTHQEAKIFAKTYHFEVLNDFYETNYTEAFLTVNQHFSRAIEHVIIGLGNDATDALIGLEHHVANVERMVETPTLVEVAEKIKGRDTAIIVSTGPSLAKQLPLLKEIQDHVTIFSVDASLPILEREGIKPDFVVSIERVIETARFFHETSKEFQEGINFLISSIVHPMLFNSIKAGTVQINMRPFGYTRYFEQPEYGYIGIGMSAANLAFEVVYHGGFKQCILIGQDLAYGEDGKSHSDGHIFGANERKQKETDSYVMAYGGNGTVRTSRIWNMFRNFFENDVHTARQTTGMVTINATEGGARIEGTVEQPFTEAVRQYVDRSCVKVPITLTLPEPVAVEANKAAVIEKKEAMLDYSTSMQKKVESLFLKVAEATEKLDAVDAYNNYDNVDFDALAAVMNELDEIKTHFNDPMFANIFIDATQATIVHQELELAKLQVRPAVTDDEKRQKMLDWVYAHKVWLFSLAGIMEAVVVAIERAAKAKSLAGKVKMVGNFLDGIIYDIEDPSKTFSVDWVIDDEVFETIEANLVRKHPFSKEEGHYRFVVELPERIFDNQLHSIVMREHDSGIVLEGTPINMVLLEKMKVNGAAWSDNKYEYYGWVKKAGSNEAQIVNVMIDGKLIDTVFANDRNRYFEKTKLSKDSLGFSYLIPRQYFDNKVHQINFTVNSSLVIECDNNEVVLCDKVLQERNMFAFESVIDKRLWGEPSKVLKKNVIGFVALEANLNDLTFVSYIELLNVKFPESRFLAIYFSETQKQAIEKTFSSMKNSIDYLIPETLEDIAREIEVFIWNNNHPIELKLNKIFIKHFSEIYSSFNFYNPMFLDMSGMSLGDLDDFYRSRKELLITQPERFGFTKKEIQEFDDSYTNYAFKSAIKAFGIDSDVSLDSGALEFLCIDLIKIIMKSPQLKEHLKSISSTRLRLLEEGL
jgi:hypothetical protein